MLTRLLQLVTAAAAILLLQSAAPQLAAEGQAPAALTGQVTSEAEGAMEGVVVSARKADSIVTVSVVTDAQGRYSFPANRLPAGKYTLKIRAIGYELAAPASADVADEQPSTADLKLRKTRSLVAQMSNAEWMMSLPGSEEDKSFLLNCVGCHTLERIVRSSHDADEWTHVIVRMSGYGPVSQPIKPQRMLDPGRSGTPDQFRKQAAYLATINLSQASQWEYPLRTLPRPTGRATRVIITEYDMPRPTTEPHDVLVDRDGTVWYSDFGELFISKFDPKTLKLTEYPVKEFKPGAPVGNLSLELDKHGALWFDTMFQGSLGALDPKTGEIKYYPLAPEYNDNRVQLNFVGLRHDVDGKVWTKSVGTQDIFRLDLASGKWERFQPLKELPGGKYSMYQVISDSQNNLWMSEFRHGHIGKIDARTGKATWYPLPTANGRARRMNIDDQDRIVIAEYRGNKIAVFDTKTEKFTEYPVPQQTWPYRAAIDKNGEIWTGGMHSDRAVRVNPKTAETVEYLLPRETNMRTVFIDNSTTPVTFWTGSNHGAALVKVEPLD
ncbi:MAG TPA: carboxypeptidase regulatory-like domain-containing protein [Xanthobacteraceae bacterium]|jgi:streptogramin lyase